MVNDVYEFPSVRSDSCWIYRSLTCHAKLHRKAVPKTFADVAPRVLECQTPYGNSDALFDCILEATFQVTK